MKTIKVYTRLILVRTGFKKFPYKEVKEYSIFYDGEEFRNHNYEVNDHRLKKPFSIDLKTRSKKDVIDYIGFLQQSRTKSNKEIISKLLEIIGDKL